MFGHSRVTRGVPLLPIATDRTNVRIRLGTISSTLTSQVCVYYGRRVGERDSYPTKHDFIGRQRADLGQSVVYH